jgi:predicted DsbA family dithiol-disulfide isomerase
MDHPVPLSPVTTDVVSDVVCPWCYLGKRRLEHAIAQIPEVPVAIRWRPFSLDPTVPPEGEDRSAYIVRKFGSLDAIDGAHQRLADFGRAEGIDYHFERITRSPNTLNAHCVVRWATTAGLGEPMVERLFAAYFSEGRDVGNIGVLGDLAGEVGLADANVAARLAGSEDRDAVTAEIEDAYRIGVTGVPCFILGGRYGVTGAQPVEALVAAIRQVAGEAVPATAS